MILDIHKDVTVLKLQQQFNTIYPYLKIELIKTTAGKEEIMKGKESLLQSDVCINIGKEQTVARLEQAFLEKTGVDIKVFRRFCNVWIETTLTDDWTLEQQNREGELLSELNSNHVAV